MNASTNASPADLERQGEHLRADLDRTLDEIERKFSPSELLDRSMEFLRDNGSDFVREAGETIRNNPVPVLLTAAGLVWLTASVASRNGSEPAASGIKQKLSGSMQRVNEQVHGARSTGSLDHIVQQQPIALGALALAAGALLGAALPITQYENELVGPVRDRTLAKARQAGEQQYENLREAVKSSSERHKQSGNGGADHGNLS